MSLQARHQSNTSSEIATKGKGTGTGNKPHVSQSHKVHLEQDGVQTHKQPRESALPRMASRYMTSWPRQRVSTESKHRPSMQQVPQCQTRRESFQFSAQRAQIRHRQQQERDKEKENGKSDDLCRATPTRKPRRQKGHVHQVLRDHPECDNLNHVGNMYDHQFSVPLVFVAHIRTVVSCSRVSIITSTL